MLIYYLVREALAKSPIEVVLASQLNNGFHLVKNHKVVPNENPTNLDFPVSELDKVYPLIKPTSTEI